MNCPECHTRPHWNGVLSHSPECSKIDFESARWYAKDMHRRVNQYRNTMQTFIENAQRWEGRFRIICHENNQLRKKLTAAMSATHLKDSP